MEHSTGMLLPHIVWSYTEYVVQNYAQALNSEVAADVYQRCSLTERGAELMFHASVIRTPLPAGVDGGAYNMQIVHEIERGVDGEIQAVKILCLDSQGHPDLRTWTDISQLSAVKPTPWDDYVAQKEVLQHVKEIGFTHQDLQAAALRMQLVRLLGKHDAAEHARSQLPSSNQHQLNPRAHELQNYRAQMDELIDKYTHLMKQQSADEQQHEVDQSAEEVPLQAAQQQQHEQQQQHQPQHQHQQQQQCNAQEIHQSTTHHLSPSSTADRSQQQQPSVSHSVPSPVQPQQLSPEKQARNSLQSTSSNEQLLCEQLAQPQALPKQKTQLPQCQTHREQHHQQLQQQSWLQGQQRGQEPPAPPNSLCVPLQPPAFAPNISTISEASPAGNPASLQPCQHQPQPLRQQQTQLPAHQQQQQQGWLGTQQQAQQPPAPISSPPMASATTTAGVPAAAATPAFLRPCVSYSRRPAHLNNKEPVMELTRYPDGQLPAGVPAWGPECKICYRQMHTLMWSGTINWRTADGQKSGSFEACGHLYPPKGTTINSPQQYWQRYHYFPPVLDYVINTPTKGFESGLWRQLDEQVATADHAAALAEGWDVAPLLLVPQKSADKSSAGEFMKLLRGANKIMSGTHLASTTVDLTPQQGVIGHSFISCNPSGPLMRFLESHLPKAARSHWCIQNQQQQKCITWGVLRDSLSPVCIATFSWFKAATGEPDAPVGQQQIIQQAAAAAGQLKQELQQQEQQLQQLGWTVPGKQKVPQMVQQNQQQQQALSLPLLEQHKQALRTTVGPQLQVVSSGAVVQAAVRVGSSRYGYQHSSVTLAAASHPGHTDAAAPVPHAAAASAVAAQPAAVEDCKPTHNDAISDRKLGIYTEAAASKRSRYGNVGQVGVGGPDSNGRSKEQQASSSKLRSRSRSCERSDRRNSRGHQHTGRSRSRNRSRSRSSSRSTNRSRSSSRGGSRSRKRSRSNSRSRSRNRSRSSNRARDKAVTKPRGHNSKWDTTSQISTKSSLLNSCLDKLRLPYALDCALSAVDIKHIANPEERDELRCLALLLVSAAVATKACTTQPASSAAAATKCPATAVSVEVASEPHMFASAKVALSDVEQLMPRELVPRGCSWRTFCSSSTRCPVLLVVGEADLQVCPRFMSLVRRHKLLRCLCVQLMTEMRCLYGPQAGVTPTQVEGLMKQHAVLMLYRQLYDTAVNFIADMLSGGAEQLVRGPDKQLFLLPKDLAAADADQHLVIYKVPRGHSSMRDVKLGSGWIGDACDTPGKQQQPYEQQQQQLLQQGSAAAAAEAAPAPQSATPTAHTGLGSLFDSPKQKQQHQQQQALQSLAGQLSTGSSIDEQTVVTDSGKPAAASGGIKIVLGKNRTVMSKLGSGKAGPSTAAPGASGTATGQLKSRKAGPIISAILTAGSGSKKSKGLVMIDEMGLPSLSPATSPPAAGKVGSRGSRSRQQDVAGPASLAATVDSKAAADVTDATDTTVTQSDYARYSSALKQMDATYLTNAELDQLRSVAVLQEVAQWLDPREQFTQQPQLELACQPEYVLDKKVPAKFLYLPPSLCLEEGCSMAQFVGTDRCSLLTGVGEGRVQVVKNYMNTILGQHTIPQKLLPVLVKRLHESCGNSGDLQQPLYMTPELCATAERLMETEPRLQPLLVYRKLYTGPNGLYSCLADCLPLAEMVLLRNQYTFVIATPAVSQQQEFCSFMRMYYQPPGHTTATRVTSEYSTAGHHAAATGAASYAYGSAAAAASGAWTGYAAGMYPYPYYHTSVAAAPYPYDAAAAASYQYHTAVAATYPYNTAACSYVPAAAAAQQQHWQYNATSAAGYAQATAAHTCSAQPQLPPGYEGYAAAYAAAGYPGTSADPTPVAGAPDGAAVASANAKSESVPGSTEQAAPAVLATVPPAISPAPGATEPAGSVVGARLPPLPSPAPASTTAIDSSIAPASGALSPPAAAPP